MAQPKITELNQATRGSFSKADSDQQKSIDAQDKLNAARMTDVHLNINKTRNVQQNVPVKPVTPVPVAPVAPVVTPTV
jgi:hypothetical protein